jgi:hypothetical protein
VLQLLMLVAVLVPYAVFRRWQTVRAARNA